MRSHTRSCRRRSMTGGGGRRCLRAASRRGMGTTSCAGPYEKRIVIASTERLPVGRRACGEPAPPARRPEQAGTSRRRAPAFGSSGRPPRHVRVCVQASRGAAPGAMKLRTKELILVSRRGS